MGHATGQLADRLHLLGLEQLGLQVAALADVLAAGDDAHRHTAGGGHAVGIPDHQALVAVATQHRVLEAPRGPALEDPLDRLGNRGAALPGNAQIQVVSAQNFVPVPAVEAFGLAIPLEDVPLGRDEHSALIGLHAPVSAGPIDLDRLGHHAADRLTDRGTAGGTGRGGEHPGREERP